ncbi:MAG: 23S rRNA (guanosine(2251)-2'-O)-methyltransferase RlmB [Deltaproteobacteria bacterium]|nr:23S rRNA (guanosine(2251)-2'-O)-methyltransferase RlmB [Deltaproteobacteria bacterium]
MEVTPIKEEKAYFIPGFHGVRECLNQDKIGIKELWIAKGKKSARIEEILSIARERDIPVFFKKNTDISSRFPDIAHQGIVALAQGFSYVDLDQVIRLALQSEGPALLIALDHITDEGNLGALIRTAAFFGAHGLIIPKDRSARVTARVLKRSSGAHVFLPVTRVVNMGRALDLLDKKGFWVIGASGKSRDSIYRFDWQRDLVLVMGNEQFGLSRSVKKRCHQVVGIPPGGHLESLNVSVACGAILSEIMRQRRR